MQHLSAYVPAFAGTHCTHPQRDGQAEFTWLANYILKYFTCLLTVTHPNTNQAWRWLISLMWPTMLPPMPKCHPPMFMDC